MNITLLEKAANDLRIATLKSIHQAGTGHLGGSLSIIELLVYIYNYQINLTVTNANSINRNQFILSKGHGVPPVYEILKERGIISKTEKLRNLNSPMQGHPDSNKCSGIDASTGSLGQGLAIAVGHAYAQKLKKSNYKTIVIVGDGELQEGICFEALSFAITNHLDNLIVIVDNNKYQLSGETTTNINVNWHLILKDIGANVQEIDGHNFSEINQSFNNLELGNVNVIIANTIKGKGISFMENNYKWHGVATNTQQYQKALNELGGKDEKSN